MPGKLTVGSLFSGMGGIEKGLEDTGHFQTVWQIERDQYATRVLERHWPEVERIADIRTFIAYANHFGKLQPQGGERNKRQWIKHCRDEWRRRHYVDLICGGFPCPPVSVAGKRGGMADERWLWGEFRRIIGVLRPRYVLVENVRGLLSANAGREFGVVLGDLARLGYDAQWGVLPAAAFGAPHIRERVFIVAYPISDGRGSRRTECEGQQRASTLVIAGSDVSDADSMGRHAWGGISRNEKGSGSRRCEPCGSCEDAPNTDSPRLEERDGCSDSPGPQTATDGRGWWSAQCRLGIHSDELPGGLDSCGGWECGIPRVTTKQKNRVDRLRCLGNAVVPVVAQWIGERIWEMEKHG